MHVEFLSPLQDSFLKKSGTFSPELDVANPSMKDLKIKGSREVTALLFYLRGIIFFQAGSYDDALLQFKNAIDTNTWANELISESYLYFYRGSSYLFKGENNDAIADLSKAIDLNTNFSEAYNNRGLAYSAEGNDTLALDDFKRAYKYNNNSPQANINIARILLDQGKTEDAIPLLEKAIELDKNISYIAYNNLGTAYINTNLNLAEKYFNKSINNNPKYSPPYINLGSVYRIQKKYPEAQKILDDVIVFERDKSLIAAAYANLGFVFTDQNQYPIAIENFTKALDADPTYSTAYFGRGLAYIKLGDVDSKKTEDDLTNAIKYSKNSHELVSLTIKGQEYIYFKGELETHLRILIKH